MFFVCQKMITSGQLLGIPVINAYIPLLSHKWLVGISVSGYTIDGYTFATCTPILSGCFISDHMSSDGIPTGAGHVAHGLLGVGDRNAFGGGGWASFYLVVRC